MADGSRTARADVHAMSDGDRSLARKLLIIQSVAVVVWAIGVVLVISQLAGDGPVYDYWLEATTSAFVILPVAVLLGRRRPHHRVTWLFTVFLCVGALQLCSGAIMESAAGLSPQMAGTLAYLHDAAQFTFVTALVSLVLLYPTGQVLSPRWRFVGYCIAASFVMNLFGLAFRTTGAYGGHQSPFAIDAPWAQAVDDIAGALLIAGIVGAILSAVLRFRRSTGIERQQMKWFAFTVVVGVLVLVFGDTLVAGGPYGALLWAVVPSAVMASVGAAIVQYGLYDIDGIVSRTLGYAVVTAVLVGVYAAASLLLAPVVAGIGGGSNAAVAVATLIVAAAFGPVRRRVQRVVDQVFDRRRYDAKLTAEAFRARLRGEVDTQELQRALVAAVHDTVAPTGVRVWVRGEN